MFLRVIVFAVGFLDRRCGGLGQFLGNVLEPVAYMYVLLALLPALLKLLLRNRPSAVQDTTANNEYRIERPNCLPKGVVPDGVCGDMDSAAWGAWMMIHVHGNPLAYLPHATADDATAVTDDELDGDLMDAV